IRLKNKNLVTPLQIFLIYTAAQTLPAIVLEFVPKEMELNVVVFGTLISFVIGAAAMIWLNHAKSYKTSVELEGKSNVASVIGWGIAGLFISLFAQQLAFYLEAFLFGGTNESANTQNLMAVTQA